MARDVRRKLPSVDALLRSAPAIRGSKTVGRAVLKRTLTTTLAEVRAGAARGIEPPDDDEILARAIERAAAATFGLTPVINATGVVLHTNLGRAPLADAAVRAVTRAAAGYSDLEVDRETGSRGRRSSRAELAPRGPDRRRGRARRQQLRRGAAPGPPDAREGQARPRVPRGADRDRRRVPDPRHHARLGREAGRGRHDEPHAPRRLPLGARCADRRYLEGPSVELPRHRLHGRGHRVRVGRARGEARDPVPLRRRLRPARPRARRRGRRTQPPRRIAGRRGPRHVQRRQAARRPAGRLHRGTRRPHREAPRASDGSRGAGRQAPGRRARGDAPSLRRRGRRRGAGARHDPRERAGPGRARPPAGGRDRRRPRGRERARRAMRIRRRWRIDAGNLPPVVGGAREGRRSRRRSRPACAPARRRCSPGSPRTTCCSTCGPCREERTKDLARAVLYALEGDVPDDGA